MRLSQALSVSALVAFVLGFLADMLFHKLRG